MFEALAFCLARVKSCRQDWCNRQYGLCMSRGGCGRGGRVLVACLVVLLFSSSTVLYGCATSPREGASGSSAASSDLVTVTGLPSLDSLQPTSALKDLVGPVTAPLGPLRVRPLSPVPVPRLPVTVESHDLGGVRDVTVSDVSRIVPLSLTGTVGGFVNALGFAANIVGRDVSTQFVGAADVPVVTRAGHAVDVESVLRLSPTVLLTDGTLGPVDALLQLRDAGVAVVSVVRAGTFEESFTQLGQVAAALGVAAQGRVVEAGLRAEIVDVSARIAALRGRVPGGVGVGPRIAFLYVRGSAGVFYLFGEGSGVGDIVSALGGVDVASVAGWRGERPMTPEALVGMDPEVLIVMTGGLRSVGGVDGLLRAQPSVALTAAGRSKRIVDVADTALFAGGMRIPQVLDGLARAVYVPESLVGG